MAYAIDDIAGKAYSDLTIRMIAAETTIETSHSVETADVQRQMTTKVNI